MELVFQVALWIVALAYVAWPLWRTGAEAGEDTGRSPTVRAYWEQQKREALAAIKEAEFDLGMGKMSQEDFAQIRDKYLGIAARAEAEIERLQGGRPSLRVAARGPSRFCPQCGAPCLGSARFCAECGSPVGASPHRFATSS